MAINCGKVEFMDGGVFNAGTVSNGSVVGCSVSGSLIDSSCIKNTTETDKQTALVFANAIAQLSTEELRALALAIAKALPDAQPVAGPERTQTEALPTAIAGGRHFVLGAPAGWLDMRGLVVPAYKVSE